MLHDKMYNLIAFIIVTVGILCANAKVCIKVDYLGIYCSKVKRQVFQDSSDSSRSDGSSASKEKFCPLVTKSCKCPAKKYCSKESDCKNGQKCCLDCCGGQRCTDTVKSIFIY